MHRMNQTRTGVLLTLVTHAAMAHAGTGPVITESGWSLESDFAFTSPMSALINPDDAMIYVGIRAGDLYRADSIGNTEMLLNTDDIAGIAYDPSTGALFFSEDFPGNIKRVDINTDGTATLQTWVTGFAGGDDDPVGITPVPNDYTGTLLTPGMMVSTDRGFNGTDAVWSWSPTISQNEFFVRDDNGTLEDPVDIAVKGSTIVIADSNESLKLLNDDATVTPLATTGATFENPQGVVFDTRSDDLLVLDVALDAIYRVDLSTGQATPMFEQLGLAVTNWGGININDDGTTQRIVVSATDADRVYVFSITPPCSSADLAGPFGQLNFFDVSAFLAAFSNADPVADFNGDGMYNFFDISAFLTVFSAGCP
ncbi:MAG: GC-type dockerin domain-anchored protein [Phycisphaerales bacterium JB052]